jgi:drug/metabolite transporter (DMT)-like permease
VSSVTASHHVFASGRQKLLGHLAMIGFASFVAGSFSIGALAAPYVGPTALNAMRFVLGTSIMGALALFLLKGRIPRPGAEWRFLVLGGLMAVFFVTMFVALRMTDPVSSGAVFTLMPIMSAFFGWLFLGQVPGRIVILSLLIAGCGAVWVVFGGDLDALLSFDIGAGELIFLVGVACHAAYAPLVRRLNRGEPVLAFTFFTLLGTLAGLVLYGASEIAATDWTSLPPIVWVSIAYLAIFTTAGTFFLLQFATMRLPAAKVLAYGYLTPTMVILYEGLLGHGWASMSVVAGAAVTVGGLAVLIAAPD